MAGASGGKTQGTASEPGRHQREYWREIAKNRYAIPAGEDAFALARELSSYLGLPDPELRDDLAYSILETWIVEQKKFSPEQLVSLLDEWRANLHAGIGETGTDSVLRRSFSALCLALLADRDLKEPFLGSERFRALLDDALAYLRDEKDLRGFDAKKGWIHATAHTSDLIAELAGNRLFAKEDQRRVLQALTQRLATASEIFAYGEQDRLAGVAAVIALRGDIDAEGWRSWISEMGKEDDVVWKETPPKMLPLARFENDSYFLRATVAQMALRPATNASSEAQKAVVELLRRR